MTYLWIKLAHLAAALFWIGGTLWAALLPVLMARRGAAAAETTARLGSLRRWDRRVTTPAMLLVWILGLALALESGFFAAPWLQAKLLFIAALSALHGLLSGSLRRLAADPGGALPAPLRLAAPATLLCVAAAIALAVTKPF